MDRLYIFFMFIPIITFHGFFQAWVAERLGDTTARAEGRLTLNPLAHIDPWGTLLIPAISLFVFQNSGMIIGWGKLVPINPYYLRQPRRDELLIALAGPFSQLILAFLVLLVGKFTQLSAPTFTPLINEFATTSVFLAFFYLLPFPWFEGWTVVRILFNLSAAWMEEVSLWWWLGLFLLIQFTGLVGFLGGLTVLTLELIKRALDLF
jgi:Zn-dependent protease